MRRWHTHILISENLGVKLMVYNYNPTLEWGDFFEKNPDIRTKFYKFIAKVYSNADGNTEK